MPPKRKYPQSARWTVTLHVDSPEAIPQLPLQSLPPEVKLCTGQLERAGTTGQLHWQMYFVFKVRMRLSTAKEHFVRMFGDIGNTAHMEPSAGSTRQNQVYVSKSETCVDPKYRFVLGLPPLARTRRELLDYFRTGGTVNQLGKLPEWDTVTSTVSIARLHEIKYLALQSKRDSAQNPVLELHIGAPGLGKSRRVFSAFAEAYPKLSGKWWDYYEDQTTVILDDFDGCSMSFGDFKRNVDRYPCFTEVKGALVPLLATNWIITTNVYPSHWWSLRTTGRVGRDAIWRRFTHVYDYDAAGHDGEPRQLTPMEYRAENQFQENLDPKGEKGNN